MIEQWRQQYNRIRPHTGTRFQDRKGSCNMSHFTWYKISAPSIIGCLQKREGLHLKIHIVRQAVGLSGGINQAAHRGR